MRLAALLSALLIVLAGCGGVADVAVTEPPDTETGTPTATPTPETDVQVIGSDLPVDATTVFRRVLTLTGERFEAPILYVDTPEQMASPASSVLDTGDSRFRAALGVAPPSRNGSSVAAVAGYAPVDGNSIHINEAILDSPTDTEVTVAHEFVHVVQFRNDWQRSVWDVDPEVRGGTNYDDRFTYYLVLEGAATFVEQHYVAEFLPDLDRRMAPTLAAYENASAHERLNLARYVLGAEYVAERVDSPRDLERVHRHPPDSTEQVLHNSTDPVETVTVTTTGMHNWTEQHRDRQGELFLRIALRTELNRSAAVDAAHGWGEDRRITFRKDNHTATAWVLHWDDTANATEFEAAFDRFLDAKATRNDSVWQQDDGNATYRVVEANDETTVVFLGNETFVRSATVNATDESQFDIGTAG
jgi:hypothetical protein